MEKELKIEKMDNGYLIRVYNKEEGRSPIKKLVAPTLEALGALVEQEFSYTEPHTAA